MCRGCKALHGHVPGSPGLPLAGTLTRLADACSGRRLRGARRGRRRESAGCRALDLPRESHRAIPCRTAGGRSGAPEHGRGPDGGHSAETLSLIIHFLVGRRKSREHRMGPTPLAPQTLVSTGFIKGTDQGAFPSQSPAIGGADWFKRSEAQKKRLPRNRDEFSLDPRCLIVGRDLCSRKPMLGESCGWARRSGRGTRVIKCDQSEPREPAPRPTHVTCLWRRSSQ